MITLKPVTIIVSERPTDVRQQFDRAPINRVTFDRAEAALRAIEALAEANQNCTAQMYDDAAYLLEVQRHVRLGILAAKMTKRR